jgi:hypothetical protein
MRAALFALAGFAFLLLGAYDFAFGGGAMTFFVLPLAIVLELAATYSAVRVFGRRGRIASYAAATAALLVALPSAGLAVVGLLVWFAPKH